MNELPPRNDVLQLKIDALSPIVKRYMSLEFALGSEVLDEGDKPIYVLNSVDINAKNSLVISSTLKSKYPMRLLGYLN